MKIYDVELLGPGAQGHEARGIIKNAIWELRSAHKAQCKGLGFVVDINSHQVAVPAGWNLPVPITTDKLSGASGDLNDCEGDR